MELRKMDQLGIETSLLGLGCMRLPVNGDGTIKYKKAEEMVDFAYQSGVNYFDTAYVYHNQKSEEFTGKALKKYERSTFYIADKLPCWLIESVEDGERIFKEQLQRLDTDYIDFYLLHALNQSSFDKMVKLGILEYCDQLKKEGKIKYFGFSFHDEYDSFEKIINYRKWDFCQIQLNYMDTDMQAGMKGYHLATELGVPLIVMEPIKGGTLAHLPNSVKKYFTAIDPKKSEASWALRWVGSLPNVKVILSGMSNLKQVVDNVKTFDNFMVLDQQEQTAIDGAVEQLRKRVKNGCTACAYCMPCPAGVDIPGNFGVWNEYGIYKNPHHTKWFWNNDINDDAKAKNCISCGACETHCPQNLKIREDLEQLQKELDLVCK